MEKFNFEDSIDNSFKGTGFSNKELEEINKKFEEHKKTNVSYINKVNSLKKDFSSKNKNNEDDKSFDVLYKEHVMRKDELRSFENVLYRWKNVYWNKFDDREEKRIASEFIEGFDKSKATAKKAENVIKYVEPFLKEITEDKKEIIVPLKNCYLVYDSEKHAFIVTKPEKKYGVRHQINVSAPETKAPLIHNDMAGYEPDFGSVYQFDEIKQGGYLDRFLSNSLKDEGKRKTTQQLVGYSLQRRLELRKFAAFYGPGRNGKSATQQLTSKLHGNPVSVELSSKDNFALETVVGASLLISPETPAEGINELWLKQLCGGDSMRIQIKFSAAKSIINKSMMFLNFNELPRFKDPSNAIKSRAVFVEFDVLDDKDVITNIADKIFDNEGKAFLDWALKGLLEVIKNEKIFECEKSIDLKNEVFDEQDSIAQFFSVKEFEEELDGRGITKTALYDEYKEFCGDYFYRFSYQRFCGRAKLKFKVSKKKTSFGREEVFLIKRK